MSSDARKTVFACKNSTLWHPGDASSLAAAEKQRLDRLEGLVEQAILKDLQGTAGPFALVSVSTKVTLTTRAVVHKAANLPMSTGAACS